jgi:hypothetical protein
LRIFIPGNANSWALTQHSSNPASFAMSYLNNFSPCNPIVSKDPSNFDFNSILMTKLCKETHQQRKHSAFADRPSFFDTGFTRVIQSGDRGDVDACCDEITSNGIPLELKYDNIKHVAIFCLSYSSSKLHGDT